MKPTRNQKPAPKRASAPSKSAAEKKQSAFLFSCIGSILYLVPCLSAIFLAVTADGLKPAFIAGGVIVVLGVPAALFAMHAFSKRAYRPAVLSVDAVLAAAHLVSIPFVGVWYAVIAPALILLAVRMITSSVITEH